MDTVTLVGRVLLSLAVVLGLMWVMARRVRGRATGRRARGGALVDMVARQQLSRNASIGVVRVLDRAFVVGITEQQLSVLAEMDAEAVADAVEEQRTAGRAPARTPRATQMTLVDG